MNVINVLSYTFIDLIPLGTIFYLHWKNFRNEAEKEYMLQRTEPTVSRGKTKEIKLSSIE